MAEKTEKPKTWTEYYAGTWWGIGQPSVVLFGELLQPYQRLIVMQEFFQPGARIDRIVETAKIFNESHPLEMIFIPEKKGPEFLASFAGADLPVIALPYDEASPDLAVHLTSRQLARIIPEAVGALGAADQGAALVVRPACEKFIPEFHAYRLQPQKAERPSPDKPWRVHHHAINAFHLLVLGVFNNPEFMVRWI